MSWIDIKQSLWMYESFIIDLPELLNDKKIDLSRRANQPIPEDVPEEIKDMMDANISDEAFVIDEFERTLINSLFISLYSEVDAHYHYFLRAVVDKHNNIDHNEIYTYTEKDILKVLRKTKHPNIQSIKVQNIRRFREIRNVLVHYRGHINQRYSHLIHYVRQNPKFFEIHPSLDLIKSVKHEYIFFILKEIENFFDLLLYEKGNILY